MLSLAKSFNSDSAFFISIIEEIVRDGIDFVLHFYFKILGIRCYCVELI